MDAGRSKGKGIEKPNYTQTPNILFDELMREMGEAELKVTLAIIRETFGWQRHNACYEMTISEMEAKTGMTRPSVTKGIADGIKRGTIRRAIDEAGKYYYGLNVGDDGDEEDKEPLLIKRRGGQGGKNSLPSAVKNFYQDGKEFLPESVNNFDQNTAALKKEKEITTKKEKEKKSSSARAEQKLTTPQADDDDDEMIAIFAAWRDEMERKLTRHIKDQLRELAAECGPEQVIRAIFATSEAGGDSFRYVAKCARNGTGTVYSEPPDEPRRNYRPDEYADIILG